jgi:hypothetical protein
MATTGQIHFTRERTVASQERELKAKVEPVEPVEPVAAPVAAPAVKAPAAVQWVGRRRSDVTREKYV